VAERSNPASPRPATHLPLDDPRWAAFVEAHPKALGYHHPAWAGVVASTYRFDAFVLATLEGDEITAGLPVVDVRVLRRRRWVALPFTDTCPPLLGPGVDAEAFTGALESARVLAGCPLLVRAPISGRVEQAAEAVSHALPLSDDPDAIQAGFHHSQRRNIRRAAKEGVEVCRAEKLEDLSQTFYALHATTRHRLGVPVQPRRFFEAQWNRLVAPGHGRLLLAYSNGAAVAGMLLLLGNGTVTYKYGASDAAAWGVRPNHALFAHAIREACLDGNHSFDFGRTDFEDQSLRDFKASWGATEVPLVYSALGAAPARKHAAPDDSPGLRRAVLRRAPAWVSRAAGELLYRYAA
jgi:CelD/BcsL family acetyltransferase involved in cellulose biosynthesis